jgi:dihydroorotate dehydrogenase electron transfer subunit
MKKYDVRECTLQSKSKLTADVYDFKVEAGELAQNAKPGQFAQLLAPGKTLRRPISICELGEGTFRFVFQVRGEGTEILSELEPGEKLNLLAPLGNGFELGDLSRRALFVGGGIGVPPLLEAAKRFGKNAVLAAGFRNAESVILQRDFESAGCKVLLATDDGSAGHHGLVTELAKGLEFDEIFACGPAPMLRAVSTLAEERGVPCQVSLEERMACGIGACLGCAVKLRGETDGYYGHVCKDGPVFDSRKVLWK